MLTRGTLVRWIAWSLAVVLAAVAVAWWLARPAAPGPFFARPETMPAAPGVLLRQEAFDRKLPAGARASRIVYTTTDTHGVATHASAIVMLAREVPAGPRPVVAWTHGTTGAVPGCGPSLLDDPFANVPALGPLLERGWVYVATDYAGQATPGPHPYLIGEGQARSALDAVRAARQMKELQLSDRTVVWGHSQGGHAALWTGILAPTYAPDVPLAGVAAAAPASDLRPLIEGGQHTPVGRIMGAFVLRAYSEVYPDVSWPAYVGHPVTRAVAFDMSGRCLAGRAALFSVAQALALGGTIFSTSPVHGALGARLQQNTPERLLTQALFVAQGDSDDLVRPEVQTRWVARRCAAGQALEYRRYAGRDHLSLVAPDSPYIDDLARWTDERFGGKPAPNGCASMPRSATP